MNYAKFILIGTLTVILSAIWSVNAYKYLTTTTIEDVSKKAEAYEKAKSDMVQAKLEYCYDNRLDSEKCEEVIIWSGKIDSDIECLTLFSNENEQFTCWQSWADYLKNKPARELKWNLNESNFREWKNNAKATTGSVIPVAPKWYTKKHTLILTGSHDYRQYSHLHPWVAGWKNNNPSGLTWWVSNTLKWLWNDAWIDYKQGTARPKNEKGYYILFWSVEHGIRAKMISIRERWWKATVSHFLAGWWTDSIKLSFPTDKLIMDLSEQEFMELFVQQLKKESPWYISQLVKDWILIIN